MDYHLFSSYTIKDITLKNRIVMSPMCMYSSENEDGKVTISIYPLCVSGNWSSRPCYD